MEDIVLVSQAARVGGVDLSVSDTGLNTDGIVFMVDTTDSAGMVEVGAELRGLVESLQESRDKQRIPILAMENKAKHPLAETVLMQQQGIYQVSPH